MAGVFHIVQATAADVDSVLALFRDHRVFHGKRGDADQERLFLADALRMQQVFIHLCRPGPAPPGGGGGSSGGQDGGRAVDVAAPPALGYTMFCAKLDTLELTTQWVLHDIRVTEEGKMQGVGEALLEHADQVAAETPADRVRRRMEAQLAAINKEKRLLENSKGALERRVKALSSHRPHEAITLVSAEMDEHLARLKREADAVAVLIKQQQDDMHAEQQEMAARVQAMRSQIEGMEANARALRDRVDELLEELETAEDSLREELERRLAVASEEVREAERQTEEQRVEFRLEQARLVAARDFYETRMAEMADAMTGLAEQLEEVEGKYLQMRSVAAEEQAGQRRPRRNRAQQTDLTFPVHAPRSQALTHSRSQKVTSDRVGPHVDGARANDGRAVAVLRRSKSVRGRKGRGVGKTTSTVEFQRVSSNG